MEKMIVRPDAKCRINLGELAAGVSSYRVNISENGNLTLTLILQAFNGHFEDKRNVVVDNFVQTLKAFYNSKLNGVFADYKKPLYIQKYCF
jgi:hypothetical protein